MIILIFFLFCAAYFAYQSKWADNYLQREYSFGSPSPPKPIPHSALISCVFGVCWAIALLAGMFWGYTYIRYPEYLTANGETIEVYFLIALFFAAVFSYVVAYKLGEINGVKQMKNTNLFNTWEHEFERKQPSTDIVSDSSHD